ncbi:MAG: DUF6279 family lipoprotein [Aestuariibacter sp.]
MKRILTALFFCLTLSSCSSQFAYNNLDWLAYWYIDDYIDLDKSQKKEFDVHLAGWLSWHRQDELQKYKAHLQGIRQRLSEGPYSQEEILNEFDAGRAHWERLRNKLSPELSQFAVHLNEQQVASLFDELAEQNQEWEEELAERKESEYLENRIEDMEDGLKEYIGKLTLKQKNIIQDYAPQFISNSAEWLKYRRHIQAKAKALFEHRAENPEFTTELLQLMTNPEQYRHDTLNNNSDNNRRHYASFLADISATLTPKQEKRIFRKIDNLIEDLQDLIDDA